MTPKEYAFLFHALSDETRVRVVEILTKEKRCACQILERLEISQPTLSHHMRILSDAGLVTVEKRGKWVHYGINESVFDGLKQFVERIGQGNEPIDECEGR
jgi:ArsR family transcriptional regulator